MGRLEHRSDFLSGAPDFSPGGLSAKVARMSDPTYSITVDISERQYRLGLRRFWMRGFGYRSIRFTVLMALGLILLGFAGMHRPILLCVCGGFFAFLMLVAISSYVRYMRNYMDWWRKMEDHTVRWEFGEAGVKRTNELATNEFKWRVFEKIWKYPDMWLLFVAKSQFLILPTNTCSPELLDYIEHWIKIGSGGRPKCSKCGYDLRGQRKTRCPECGTEFDEDLLKIK